MIETDATPKRAGTPSRPRAPLWARVIVYLLMLALAAASIWWIDRGAMLTNSVPGNSATGKAHF
jgi:hypothetical protein